MKELKSLVEKLKGSFNRWEYLKIHGGQDPFWSDGCNMDLVRNHIFSYKRQIKELCEEKGLELPELYYRETPPEVDRNYMARPDEIRKNANRALREYRASKDYQYLTKTVIRLNKKQIEETSIKIVIGYCKGLEKFIKDDDLVAMRRHERWERYIQGFYDCRKRVERTLKEKPKKGQISMFEVTV